ncbi:hypothetical protein [Actinomadura bangladeshensis]|uniref:Uncharacterized protein n=1 Tax=Actinomadura bangladeshensis TaxID=453573 RepID=A0A4R4NB06_9ACTN|nr:hypothetical protein [Actinomadura bangladeshensis]TDC06211.1 hypothetical protein E1284_34190 [Actinomadura bangladeshensis]
MSPKKPLEQVTLADLATKDDLKDFVTKDDLNSFKQEVRQEFGSVRQEIGAVRQELGSAVNLIMGELGKMAARQEEMAGTLARLVARSEGVVR